MTDDILLLSVFVAVEGAHSFSAFLPSAFTIRTFASDPQALARVRAGYLPAFVFLAALAATVAALKRSLLPLLLAAATGMLMVMLYEYSIADRERELQAAGGQG